jgi:hypothetical protein
MCDSNQGVLDQIAQEIGEITDEQDDSEIAQEGDEFDPEDYHRDRDDEYDGNR